MSGPSTQALGAVRPGDPQAQLADAMGERWRPPRPHQSGKVDILENSHAFIARIDRDGRVGEVRFERRFDPNVTIEGLRIAMPLQEARLARPDLDVGEVIPNGPPMRFATLPSGSGLRIGLTFNFDTLYEITIRNPDAEYPAKVPLQYPSERTAPGAPFADPNLKLVVMDALLWTKDLDLDEPETFIGHALGRDFDAEDEGFEFVPEAHDLLARYPLSPQQLASVTYLVFDGGIDIYTYAFPFWDGETDEFDVKRLDGIEHCQNVKHIDAISMMSNVNLSPLLKLPKLESLFYRVDDGTHAISNAVVRERLAQRGVSFERVPRG